MTTSLQSRWRPADDYDDEARRLDEADGGDRWRAYGACGRVQNPDRFFPVEVERRVTKDGTVVDVPTDVEPPYPPADVKEICDRCPVSGICLTRNMDEEYGIFGGMTGYQRGLLTKRITRKRCVSCGSPDVVKDNGLRNEICTSCGASWAII